VADDDDREYAAWGDDTEDDGTEIVAALEPGTFFADRFQVDGRLGMGAMGKVVTATDMTTGQRVALKVLHREKAAQREAAERFTREADVLARLGHPGIVRVVASDKISDGTRWLAMELIEGDTIAQHLRKKGPFTPVDAYPIVSMICDALDAAHRAEVVHRDLKPENIMLPRGGMPPAKILDFGLARFTQMNVERLTRAGTILGTPRYMAPELIETLKDTDHRADVFAIGVITYELLTGKSIYAAEDVGQLFGAILEGRMRTLQSLRPDLPASLGAVIARAAMRKPADRYQTAGAFAEAYAAAAGIPSQRSGLGADVFDDQTSLEMAAPLVDPYAPSLPRPAPVPSMTRPSAVAIAPMRAISDRPKAQESIGTPRLSASRLVGSQKRTMEGHAIPSTPPPSFAQGPMSYGGPPVMPAPQPVYVAPVPLSAVPPTASYEGGIAPEGRRPFSDRPPPFAGADQAAPSVHPSRQRSFTPPLGVQGDGLRPIGPPSTRPAAPPKSRTWIWIALAVLVVLAAVGVGVGLRFVIEHGLLPH
jgi:serine/threonine protein kinase